MLKRDPRRNWNNMHKISMLSQITQPRHSGIKLKPVQPKMKKRINKKAVIGILESMVSPTYHINMLIYRTLLTLKPSVYQAVFRLKGCSHLLK